MHPCLLAPGRLEQIVHQDRRDVLPQRSRQNHHLGQADRGINPYRRCRQQQEQGAGEASLLEEQQRGAAAAAGAASAPW